MAFSEKFLFENIECLTDQNVRCNVVHSHVQYLGCCIHQVYRMGVQGYPILSVY